MSSDVPAAELREVSKEFGKLEAVENLSMTVTRGNIFGLIGPSGCGKTTTVRMMMGVLVPTKGTVRVLGADPAHLKARQRERLGYAPQGSLVYPTLTAWENVSFVAGLFGVGFLRRRSRMKHVLQFLELWDARNRLARDLSGGMKRRLGLACALVHGPEFLIVDEPTAGLDPVLREKVWGYLRRLKEEGTTVLVTTQLIEEIQQCDMVALLVRGRLVAMDSPQALRRQALGGEAVDVWADTLSREHLVSLRALAAVNGLRWNDDGSLRVLVDDAGTATPEITQSLQGQGVSIQAMRPYEPSFDEVFQRLVAGHRA